MEDGKIAAKLIFDVVNRVPMIRSESSQRQLKAEYKGRIEFKNVGFFYPKSGKRKVLSQVSFIIEHGKKTAIVGK
jgi:ABC-type multidrug transport system fused ATPase/permease subunit